MSKSQDRPNPTLEAAIERFIAQKRPNWNGGTERTYRKSLATFEEYAQETGIETIDDLSRWDIGGYTDWLLQHTYEEDNNYTKGSVNSKQKQARRWIKWLEGQGLVEKGFHVSIETLKLDDDEYASDDILEPERLRDLLVFYRNSKKYRGTREHAILEVIAHTGARRIGIRALDLRDWDFDQRTLTFKNRPDTDTRLKNGNKHERKVILSEEPATILDEYVVRDRFEKRDKHGRQPLFSSRQGRPTKSTITNWAYSATVPCIIEQCPHSRERHNCEWAHQQTKASQCPSSSSPHPIRRGSITWQLNIGRSIQDVADRAGTTPGVIRRYYDKPDLDAELRRRITDFQGVDICEHQSPNDIDADSEEKE